MHSNTVKYGYLNMLYIHSVGNYSNIKSKVKHAIGNY